MLVRVAQSTDIEMMFDIRTSVIENHQSREEITALGITPESVAEMLATDCCAWIAELEEQPVGFAIAFAAGVTSYGLPVKP